MRRTSAGASAAWRPTRKKVARAHSAFSASSTLLGRAMGGRPVVEGQHDLMIGERERARIGLRGRAPASRFRRSRSSRETPSACGPQSAAPAAAGRRRAEGSGSVRQKASCKTLHRRFAFPARRVMGSPCPGLAGRADSSRIDQGPICRKTMKNRRPRKRSFRDEETGEPRADFVAAVEDGDRRGAMPRPCGRWSRRCTRPTSAR